MGALTAGQKLRRSLNAELAKAGKAQGLVLAWTPAEVETLSRAAAIADRAETLQAAYQAALAADDTALALRLATELRLADRAIAEMVTRLQFGPPPAKSERHVRSARARWDRGAEVLS